MKKVFTSSEEFRIGYIVSVLEELGIEHTVRNQYLSGAVGELPLTECWPEIWITNDKDLTKTKVIIEHANAKLDDQGAWECQCGEKNEGQFGSCWHCGSDKTQTIAHQNKK